MVRRERIERSDDDICGIGFGRQVDAGLRYRRRRQDRLAWRVGAHPEMIDAA